MPRLAPVINTVLFAIFMMIAAAFAEMTVTLKRERISL
jgi:hypothetical protein